MNTDVFISYASPERTTAQRICDALEANGIRCWMAPRDVAAASHYSGEIIRGLNQCRAVVVVVSPSANRSWHVLREIERAVSKRKQILPVRLQEIGLSDDLEYFISVVHWLDAFSGIDAKLRDLEAAVRQCLNNAETPFSTRPAQDAPTPKGKMETFARSWTRTLSSFRESATISEAEHSNVVRELAGSDWNLPEQDDGLAALLVSNSDARHRAFIDSSDGDAVRKIISSPAAASAHRVLYAIKTGLPLVREHLDIRFVLIPPGTTPNGTVNQVPFYLSESLVSEVEWNKIAGVPLLQNSEAGRAKTNLSPRTALRLIEETHNSPAEWELCIPTVEQWEFVSNAGSNAQPAAIEGPRLRRSRASGFGLHDLLGVAWQICRASHSYQLRGGSYLRRMTPATEEPPMILCENTALCGEDVGLRLALVPKQQ